MKAAMFFKQWWALDMILRIGEPIFDNRMGHGGYFITFGVEMCFRNETLWMQLPFEHGEVSYSDRGDTRAEYQWSVLFAKNNGIYSSGGVVPTFTEDGAMVAMTRVYPEWEKFVEAWKGQCEAKVATVEQQLIDALHRVKYGDVAPAVADFALIREAEAIIKRHTA